MKKLPIILLGALLFLGCAKKEVEAPDSIETIQKREGIPVRVEKLAKQDFEKYISFKGKIEGNQESTVVSMIAGKVESIKIDVNEYAKEDAVVITVPNDVPSSQFNQAKEAYDLSETTQQRMQNLYEKGAISKQDLDQTETQNNVNKSNFEAISKTINVEAPISGRIGVMYAQVGKEIEPGTKLFKIVDDSKFKVRINVPESLIMQVKKRQTATAIWNNIELSGRVDKVSSSLDEESNSFLVDLVFKNSGQNIKTGVTAEIRLNTYSNHSVVVNEQYISKSNDSNYVYLAKDNKAVRKQVVLGAKFAGTYEIINGINENDILITEGSKLVEPNALIKIIR